MFGGSIAQNPKLLMIALIVVVIAFIIVLGFAIYYHHEYSKLAAPAVDTTGSSTGSTSS